MMEMLRKIPFSCGWLLAAVLAAVFAIAASVPAKAGQNETKRFFETLKAKPPLLRMFLQKMPKGGDLHNHLGGSAYAESYLEWAAADGLCVDISVPAIVKEKTCKGLNQVPASAVLLNEDMRRKVIDGLSMRSFVATPGWSGHDQFFVTFDRMKETDDRFWDILAEVTNRAGRQNLGYMELMETGNTGDIFKLLGAVKKATPKLNDVNWVEWKSWSPDELLKNMKDLRKAVEKGVKGKSIKKLVEKYIERMQKGEAERQKKLGCAGSSAEPGCKVKIRFLYQNLRSLPPDALLTQLIFSFAVTKDKKVAPLEGTGKVPNPVVGMNLVTPEDWMVATRDYRLHMAMIDFLWGKEGSRNISLHAGELTLGNVLPAELKYRIDLAIEKGHAKRIGHGVDIAHETKSLQTLKTMADEKILIEINLVSNKKILGVSGRDHPVRLYKTMGVPIALSTDDEGVLRSDITRDYMLAVLNQGFGYDDLVIFSENSLTYSFLEAGEKTVFKNGLAKRFTNFDKDIKSMAIDLCGQDWWNKTPGAVCKHLP